MLVPDGIYAYDADAERTDKYPETFITEDITKKNPESPEERVPTGYLWLELSERAPDVWKKLCFERMTKDNDGDFSNTNISSLGS